MNRCIYYNTQQPHSTPTDQWVEEVGATFFLITKDETFKKFKEELEYKSETSFI